MVGADFKFSLICRAYNFPFILPSKDQHGYIYEYWGGGG
ncbi:hypothetical protein HHE06_06470 [Helicobacter heilmannii]|nr:hypothetical protein HHE06_06470 [Helicobacter heilmannii]